MGSDIITYVDLFSGVGGLSLGFEKEGFENVFAIDFDRNACKTYRNNFQNNTMLEKDIKNLTEKEILDLAEGREVDAIIGGTPCQGFSIAGGIGRKFINDPRNHLFKEFARVVEILSPKFFVIENVARVFNHNKGKTREEILGLFETLGYRTDCRVLNAADYGVPQIRSRIFFIGNRLGLDNKFPKKTVERHKTVAEVIAKLPRLESGGSSRIPNHVAMNHSQQMLEKMSHVSNGGSRADIPSDIRPKSGDVRKYIRYDSNEPSVCITGDMRKVFHYDQNRALTVRELARIQSFPDYFVFEGPTISQQMQVGNAVPPLLAQALAKTVKKQLQK